MVITKTKSHTQKTKGKSVSIPPISWHMQTKMWKMGRNEENQFEFVKIKTHVLKVHIHCQGCMHKVKKLLRKVEGVYEVKIEAGQHKVTVSGKVNITKLIEKLAKSGKHAELWTLPASSNWRKNDAYLNKLHGPVDSLNFSGKQPQSVYRHEGNTPRWEFESHSKDSHGPREQWGANIRGQNEDIITDMRYNTGFPGYYAAGQFDTYKNMHGVQPVYEYQYHLPAVMENNMQGPWYNNYPYPMMYMDMPDMHPVNDLMEKIYAFY